jgi:hypothetical protein
MFTIYFKIIGDHFASEQREVVEAISRSEAISKFVSNMVGEAYLIVEVV